MRLKSKNTNEAIIEKFSSQSCKSAKYAKTTIKKIAELAGVGTATVERVLNERGGVRPETVEKVIRALRDVDYPRRIPGKHQGLMRIDVLLVNPQQTFFERLARAFARIAATLDPAISVHRTFMDESNPEAIARKLMDPTIRRSAVIIAAPEHPAVRRALFVLRERGMPSTIPSGLEAWACKTMALPSS
jgi:LacI family transcriptional regulator